MRTIMILWSGHTSSHSFEAEVGSRAVTGDVNTWDVLELSEEIGFSWLATYSRLGLTQLAGTCTG